ncbi:hypothetical protein GCM10012275_02280 [Longimycelium tulufanense]|uniref:DUF397 domain-containing protein n=1 Tax=Longimycelium tulufanense TaxID=907463 RepID=A0A8J3C9Y4_9PSEU|nr:DUF397 domain-containing protein [Longimycelium tulufanense]GGM34510.1 hypothetical protein GCM10012275_02280 [Longimycelium tulufanense]
MPYAVPGDTGWFKSSHSGGGNDQCVEVRMIADAGIGVRDSKNRDHTTLWFTLSSWGAFIAHVKHGRCDLFE